jgi:hypothetical protein
VRENGHGLTSATWSKPIDNKLFASVFARPIGANARKPAADA